MTDRPTHAQLLHLLNRAIDGVVLHGEGDHLRELVCALYERSEQAEAAIGRVRNLATQWAVLRTYGSAATELRAALDQVEQQPTA